MKYISLSLLSVFCVLFGEVEYNHPEFNWQTFETDHFKIHFYDETEISAREAASVAEKIYGPITNFYDFYPKEKTHIILTDPDDYSNGAAYYYDNKIKIWATPLDFELRGSHRWLQNVITHEFAHIVSLQKAMKAGTKIPGLYLQLMQYEKEKRPDVLYGFPNTLISYPIPGTVIPPWLAEGTAQYMYGNADWDTWDSHRDMILRDRVIFDKMMTFNEINTFGKKGIGNESTYNTGFAFATYIANRFGSESIKNIFQELSSPFEFSIDNALYKTYDIGGVELYNDFKDELETRYKRLVEPLRLLPINGKIIRSEGTTNIHPKWSPDGKSFIYLSNKNNDYFGQTTLYHYDVEKLEEKKIKSSVYSAPTWHSNGEIVFYSKKTKYPNKKGSRFYDIYSFNLDTDKEERLTFDSRAYSPVFISKDSSIAFISTYDGGQNLNIFNPKTNKSKQITNFDERPMISHLNYDESSHSLYFDITFHHFREIYNYNLNDSVITIIKNNTLFDERNMAVDSFSGVKIYSRDKSGIFNLYMIDEKNESEGYISNVTGGAFMPDISNDGKIIFSLFQNGGYKISVLEESVFINDNFVGYDKNYFFNNRDLAPPITSINNSKAKKYEDQFPNMFIMPKLMYDYNTLKPGFYFQSSEIIDRLSLFGEASMNSIKDVDYMFRLNFRRFYQTVFFETYYLTRNTADNSLYQNVYKIADDIKFRLVQFRLGLKQPFFGSQFEYSISRQWYRAFIQQTIQTNEYGRLDAGAAYDYFRGWVLNTNWSLNRVKRGVNSSINPSSGFKVSSNISFEKNDFIEGLNLSDAGTLLEEFRPNNLVRLDLHGSYYSKIPFINYMNLSIGGELGWISKNTVDSFFHFYLGGIPGIKGYSFYSIQGTKKIFLDFTFRIPIFTQQHYKIGWVTIQNSTIGLINQIGDAWDPDKLLLKKSVGIQWRINGFSFYNFPTAIELEYHQPRTTFSRTINNDKITYGDRSKTYVKILFDF
ncbi:MAG: hypothetical protein ACJZ10_03905 [Candidatus Neomarinimicrobiota bacterium]